MGNIWLLRLDGAGEVDPKSTKNYIGSWHGVCIPNIQHTKEYKELKRHLQSNNITDKELSRTLMTIKGNFYEARKNPKPYTVIKMSKICSWLKNMLSKYLSSCLPYCCKKNIEPPQIDKDGKRHCITSLVAWIKKMALGDVVFVRLTKHNPNGKNPVALVEITSDYYIHEYINKNREYVTVPRRNVKILKIMDISEINNSVVFDRVKYFRYTLTRVVSYKPEFEVFLKML